MSEHTSPPAVDPLYVAARSVLLDALTALQPHGLSVIVAGAQAIYLRTGDADLAIAPYTTDGDLALDPAKLAEAPPSKRRCAPPTSCSAPSPASGSPPLASAKKTCTYPST